jgi:hypothetical protein
MFRRFYQVVSLFAALLLWCQAAAPAIAVGPLDSPQAQTSGADGPLPLSSYPRPKNDNGLGIHWSTHIYGQRPEVTDYFVNELVEMDIKWVKFLNDQVDGRDYDYLVEQLVANDIMPVMRIYISCNRPMDLGAMGRMLEHYVPMGVYYYELYNEPNIPGFDGGWCDEPTPDPEYLEGIWAPAAREIISRGGYPSLPSFFPVGKGVPGWEDSFFQRFLQTVKDRGDTDILYRSWGSVHNYMINHPPDYPMDDVNLTGRLLTADEIELFDLAPAHVRSINQARAEQFEPGGYFVGDDPTEDMTNFLQFVSYHDQFTEIFDFEIPLLSTEGGATVGSCEDPRYPCVDERMQMEWTLASREYMLDEAPEYYFNTCTWLLAQRALDYFGGTVWESNAWYHDMEGDHLPIVDALKEHPRKGEPRWDQKAVNNWSPGGGSKANPWHPATTASMSGLAAFPRPPKDNGRGVHYAPTILAQSPEVVDFLVYEMLDMNIKWVKIMQGDIPKVEHQYLIEQLTANGIEPVLRVYRPYNTPYEHLPALTAAAGAMGVHYFELYNEPNIAGFPGGWQDGEAISVARMLDLWIPAAESIQRAGGFSGLPSLAVGGDYDDMIFLADFLDGLQVRGRGDLLVKSWIPLHNYLLNHPLDYPVDAVNLRDVPLTATEIKSRGLSPEQVQAINTARANARQPGGYYVGDTIHEDSNSFRKFEAYAKIFHDRFGFFIPIISTEGGAIAGDAQDPRYPTVNDDDVTDLTLRGYRAMLDDVPAYYFAFTPWLLANGAGQHWDPAWEAAAWYKVDGTTLPVVPALKTDPSRLAVREWSTDPGDQPTDSAIARGVEPDMPALSTKIVPVSGEEQGWNVESAEWQSAYGTYPRIRIDVLDSGGTRVKGEQVRVSWSGGWTVLVTGQIPNKIDSLPISAPSDVYVINVAGASGQAVVARGAEGHDLRITFRQQ